MAELVDAAGTYLLLIFKRLKIGVTVQIGLPRPNNERAARRDLDGQSRRKYDS